MRVVPNQDERDLAAMCRGMLAAECPTTLARTRGAERLPLSLRKALARSGVLGLPVDESYEGSGGSLSDVGIFAVEAGRALCPTVVHSSMHAALAIAWLSGPMARACWLRELASGAAHGAVAICNARDAADVRPRLIARAENGDWLLSGAVDFVADADLADVIVVTADDGAQTLAFVVEPGSPGVTVEPLAMMGGFPAFTVRFDDVAVDEPSPADESRLRRVANAIVALHCLDLVGVGEAVVQRTVDYTTVREQFGRPIASFQAAQHLIADMHIALAAARLTAQSAVFSIGRGRTGSRETAIARMRAAEVKKVTLDAHQLHGGMGYVVDTDLHLYSERARVLATLGGGADIAAKWLEHEMNWEDR